MIHFYQKKVFKNISCHIESFIFEASFKLQLNIENFMQK